MRHSQFYARVKMRADGVDLGRRADARQRAADDGADRPRRPAGRRLPPDRRRALRASGRRRRRHRRVGRLRDARAHGRDRHDADAARARLGRRRRAARRRLAPRRRVRDVRRSATTNRALGAVWLASGAASAVWNAPRVRLAVPAGGGLRPSRRLCLGAAALGDGIHAGAVGGQDASGGQAAPLAFTVRIDATPPAARLLAPGAVASDARPGVELEVGDATSGVASVAGADRRRDGAARRSSGARASGRPAAALAYGRAHARLVGRRRRGQPHGRQRALRRARPAAAAAVQRAAAAEREVHLPGVRRPVAAPRRQRGGRGAGCSREGRAQARVAGARPAGARRVVPAARRDRAAAGARPAPHRRAGALRRRHAHAARARERPRHRHACGSPARAPRPCAWSPGRAGCSSTSPARRLPLRLQVQPQRRSAPTVARVSGRLAELRGRVVVLEALTATGWRRVGQARADASGRFATSFAIVHAGQFALRARVAALAAVAERALRAHDALTSGVERREARRLGRALGGLGALALRPRGPARRARAARRRRARRRRPRSRARGRRRTPGP